MKKILTGVFGLFLAAAGPVFASSSVEHADSQLKVKTENGIPYLSGGFGVDERENLRAMTRDDNLELSFALQNRDYLGGAKVLIKDRNGTEIISVVSDGPLFFAKLPQGSYIVEATATGKTLKQVARVPVKGETELYFAWQPTEETASQTIAQK